MISLSLSLSSPDFIQYLVVRKVVLFGSSFFHTHITHTSNTHTEMVHHVRKRPRLGLLPVSLALLPSLLSARPTSTPRASRSSRRTRSAMTSSCGRRACKHEVLRNSATPMPATRQDDECVQVHGEAGGHKGDVRHDRRQIAPRRSRRRRSSRVGQRPSS